MTRKEKGLILILVIVGVFAFSYFKSLTTREEIENKIAAKEAELQTIKINSFANLNLLARSAIVYDLNKNEMIFGFHENMQLPIASITKIMTALSALNQMPETTIVTVGQNAIKEDGDNGLRVGEKWPLSDLLKFMLVGSSNDAAAAIASAKENKVDFLENMNKFAKDLNLSKTSFLNETGLDLSVDQSGALSSARDIANLAGYFYAKYPDIFKSTGSPEFKVKSESGLNHLIGNTDILVSRIPEILASKTGYTDLAGGNLVLIIKIKPDQTETERLFSLVVLGSTIDGRFGDMEKLISGTTEYAEAMVNYGSVAL